MIFVVVLIAAAVVGAGLYFGGVFGTKAKENVAAPAAPEKKETKAEKLLRDYDELKVKVKALQDRQQDLKRTRAAHDEAFEAEYAVAKINRDALFALLERRQKQVDQDAEAITASARSILALYDQMRSLLDQLERENDPSSRDKLRERRQELDKSVEAMKPLLATEKTEPPTTRPEPKTPPGPRVLSQPEIQERNRMLAVEEEREKTDLPPLLAELEKQKKALADIQKRVAQKTLPVTALAPAVEKFQAAEKKYHAAVNLIEQNRRRIKNLFRMPGDPEFFPKGNGDLYTKEEYDQVTAMQARHGSPEKAATAYVNKLVQDRVIEKATFLKVTDYRDPRAVNPDGTPAPVRYLGGEKPREACRKVWFQVRYAVPGGQQVEREGFVSVFTEGGNWYLLPSPTFVLPGNRLLGVNITFPDE